VVSQPNDRTQPPATADLDAIRGHLDKADGEHAFAALPHLRQAADLLNGLLDDCMAAALLNTTASLASTAHQAGLTPNAVGPRLARTTLLGAYADNNGRVTATGLTRARYDHEQGSLRPATQPDAPMRFKPRRPNS
jgi:hypothetical protein